MKMRHALGLLGLIVLIADQSSVSAQWRRNTQAIAVMSGTYELQPTRSDDPRRAAEAATRDLRSGQRDRVYQNLLNRLDPPETLAIERRGRQVTIASSRGPRTTFDADGQARREEAPNGRFVTTRADIIGDRLSVSTTGNRGRDYSVTFEPLDNANGLRVTRRLDADGIRQPIQVQSYYRRVSIAPRWDIFESGGALSSSRYPSNGSRSPVTEGTRLFATLDAPLSTRTSHAGEQFTATVRSPSTFAGARIEGTLSSVETDRDRNVADLRINFERIQMRDGRRSEFNAVLDNVRLPDGSTLRVDPESGVRDTDTTNTRIEHGAIGAAVGAVIGAIAGGGKGAAIGAAIGGAGGAILVNDRDELDLPGGTELTIVATGPRYLGS